jgi:hypothetical protein
MVHRLRGARNATQDDKHVHGATLLPTRASSRPKSEREQQTWSDKQGGPLQVSKQRLKTEMCPVTRAPNTKSAMTRNMGKSIAEIILTDRRKKSSRENQRMGLENGTLRQPVKKSIPKTRPAQPSNLSPVNQSSRANRTRSPHGAFALASSRIEYEQASKPSDQAPIIHKHINRSAGRGHHRESP